MRSPPSDSKSPSARDVALEVRGEVRDRDRRVRDEAVLADLLELALGVVLVADVADELLEDVLERDDAGGPPNSSETIARCCRLRLHLAEDARDDCVSVTKSAGVRTRSASLPLSTLSLAHRAEEVLRVEQARRCDRATRGTRGSASDRRSSTISSDARERRGRSRWRRSSRAGTITSPAVQLLELERVADDLRGLVARACPVRSPWVTIHSTSVSVVRASRRGLGTRRATKRPSQRAARRSERRPTRGGEGR